MCYNAGQKATVWAARESDYATPALKLAEREAANTYPRHTKDYTHAPVYRCIVILYSPYTVFIF